jgi:hypothetical protein
MDGLTRKVATLGLALAVFTLCFSFGRAEASAGNVYKSLPAARLMDSRNGTGTTATAFAPGEIRKLQIAGVAGVPLSGAVAVMVDITAVYPSASSFVTVYPTGTTRPNTSHLNTTASEVITNSAVVKLGSDGAINVYNNSGSTHLVVDVQGYWTNVSDSNASGGGFRPIYPKRVLDTRQANGGHDGPLASMETAGITVTGNTGVPVDATAVVINITGINPATNGHLTAFPAGATQPAASTLDTFAGNISNTLATVAVGVGGQINLNNHNSGSIHVVIDIQGYYAPASRGPGGTLTLLNSRLYDSRTSGVTLASNEARDITVLGVGGIPTTGISGVILNLTVANPTATGHLRAWPALDPEPSTSNLNFNMTYHRAGLMFFPVDGSGKVRIRNSSAGTIHLIVDTQGYLSATVPSAPRDVTQGTVAADGTLSVQWKSPTYNSGSAVSYYVVSGSPGNIEATTSGLSYKFTGLTPGTNYVFGVAARNATGEGLATISPAGYLDDSPEGVGYTVIDYDENGQYLGEYSGEVCLDCMNTYGSTSGGSSSYSGCRSVRYNYRMRSTLGFTIYKWWQEKYWCWRANAVTYVQVSAYLTNVDATVDYRGIKTATDYYRTALNNTKGEHYSMRQASIAHCVLKYGCYGYSYPYVRIYARGNGTWSANWGK